MSMDLEGRMNHQTAERQTKTLKVKYVNIYEDPRVQLMIIRTGQAGGKLNCLAKLWTSSQLPSTTSDYYITSSSLPACLATYCTT